MLLSRAKDQENTPKRPRVEQDITILDNPDKVTSAHSVNNLLVCYDVIYSLFWAKHVCI